ncbi:NAD-dependent epimerase/dehydratase family protein [Candidatus Woesearchaeota archaeon]|nr:NAD-dependent epimerase/dehydratase family protein [Candidatus Woesearchaeota archaeon]
MTTFFAGKQILVTGGSGFLGSHFVEKLVEAGADVTVSYRNKNKVEKNLKRVLGKITLMEGNLYDPDFCNTITHGKEIVCHLAADVGGIHYNVAHPGTIFKENLSAFMNVLDASRKNKVGRFLTVSSACIYSTECTIPTPESEGCKNVPEQTNEGYGWAKRMEEFLSRAYAREFGMKIAIIRPSNMYGPRDNVEPEKAHVIPNLLTKIMSGEDKITVFGTGKPTRAFLYVEDFCDGAMAAVEHACDGDPINIGSDEEISIKNLVGLLCKHAERAPKIVFDTTKPDGHMRRASDISKAKAKLHFKPKISIEEGIKKTIAWYKEEMSNGNC